MPFDVTITPFGIRPTQCVLEVPSGSHVYEHPSGVRVLSPMPGSNQLVETIHTVDPACHQDNIVEKMHARRKVREQADAFPINGWLDYGGWYPPTGQNNLDSFVSTYTTPGNPSAPNGPEVLFYFIGMQNNAYPNAVNILQPVLTWGNGVSGWNLASWDCCPSNITVKSTTITGFGAGDTIVGTIKRQDASTWIIDSLITKTGKNTTLYSHVGNYLYDWADVTLEVYNIVSCADFANGPMTFSNLLLKDAQQQALTPSWQLTGATDCSGKITVSGNTAVIQHSTS
jgi:hypothetical protein